MISQFVVVNEILEDGVMRPLNEIKENGLQIREKY